ncbi:MAG: hypothetical protein COY04_01330 [Parcubacteria group bacterium CG_4_10_14_0_2_um_filter_7_35_8]|nr:MAG: hypothetical protein COY04_01330 [Parcubacteria group bacterium CG_4_10_14_0_2_um_filter_7_35_8]
MSGKDKIESGAPKGIKHTLSENKKLEDMATQKIPNRTQEHFQKTLGEKEREQDTTQKSFLNRMSTIFKHMLSKEESKVGVQPGKRAEVDLPDGDEDIDHRKDIDDKDKKDIDKDKKDRKDIDDKDKKDIHDKDKKDIDKKDRKDIDDKDKKDIHDKKGAGKKEEGSETARKEGALTATDKVVVQQLGDTIIKGIEVLVENGHLPHLPNFLSIYPVTNPQVRRDLGDTEMNLSVADLKKSAIRESVETAIKRYGLNPHHRFGMSDDDPKNVELVTEEMRSLKQIYPEMSFFVIQTFKDHYVKTEIVNEKIRSKPIIKGPETQLTLF